jgi:hypothetical protein
MPFFFFFFCLPTKIQECLASSLLFWRYLALGISGSVVTPVRQKNISKCESGALHLWVVDFLPFSIGRLGE